MHRTDCAALARGCARLLAATLLLVSCAHAEPLSGILARNAALPRAPLLDPELFNRPERLRDVRLAPDGSQLAWIEEADGKAELLVMPLAGGAPRALAALEPRDRIHWSRDGTVLFVAQEGGVAAIGVRDGAGGRIAVFDKHQDKNKVQRFAGVDRAMPRHALVEEHDLAANTTTLVRIGADGARSILYRGPGKVDASLSAQDGVPAILRRQDRDFRQLILRRSGQHWVEAAACRPLRPCIPVALSPDGARLFLRTPHEDDREALVELDLASGARRLVHDDPQALSDLVHVTLNPRSGRPMLAAYLLPRLRLAGLDAEGKRIAAGIARRFPEGGVLVESCAPGACLLVEHGARLAHARFWILDLRRHGLRPVLDAVRARVATPAPQQLAERIALRYPASDGALVHGYLTLPPGLPARGLPMVTLVHGGPWNHVDGGYSALAQLLANRGVAVFQPNFRGSTGYGSRYMLAPGADFGNGRVQADIIDGVRWLLAQGVGDPRRLGIVGGSFGGYATLLALTHTPELFRFGMATQPPPDFARTLRLAVKRPPAAGEVPFGLVLRELGIDAADPAVLAPIERDAPARHAVRVSAPLLLVAGGRDDKVEVEAVVDYVARLQGLGKPVGLLLDPELGHNTDDPVVKGAQVHLLLRMLQLHLGGPPAPAPGEAVARYLARSLRATGALGR
jgi:dipeptidyl aminopeptidase/acylaminoacyl peptidase